MNCVEHHLLARDLKVEDYPDLVVDEVNKVVTFPMWNLSGQLVGVQTYRPFAPKKSKELRPHQLKYWTYLSKPDRKRPALNAWGLQYLSRAERDLFVVEGVFDAVKLHALGKNCLALLSCDPKHLKQWVNLLGYRVVPVCEGDIAGRKMAKLSEDGILPSIAQWFRSWGYVFSRSVVLS